MTDEKHSKLDDAIERVAKVGRPRHFKSPEQFEEAADAYFKYCLENDEPLTVTGLCLAVGLCSRSQLDEYQAREEFTYSVKKAKMVVEKSYERDLRGQYGQAGIIFALKNFNWTDKSEIDHRSGDGSMSPTKVEIVPMPDKPGGTE